MIGKTTHYLNFITQNEKEASMIYKKLLISVGILAITLLFTLSTLQAEEKNDDSYDALVVAKVGDKEVKYGDLNKWIKMMPPSYQSMFNDPEQMKKLLDRQINNILFSDEAIRLKLDQKPDVKDKIEEFTKGILMQALVEEKVNKNIAVSDKEIEEYYTSHQDEFKIPEKIKVSYILVKVDPKAQKEVNDEKKAKAEEILAKARAGEDFSALAKQYSEDTKTKNKGGVLPFFAKGSKDSEFEKAAFNLKKNEISDPILTKKGYNIIKLTDKKEGRTKSLKEASNKIENKLKQKNRNEAIENLLNDLKAKSKVVIYEDALTKVTEKSKGKSEKK